MSTQVTVVNDVINVSLANTGPQGAPGTGSVASVFGRTGSITAQSGDYSAYYDPLGAAATAQSNAEIYASDASNLTSGTVNPARIPTLNQNTTGQAGTVATINGLISAGSNITITGSGTSGDPYSIAGDAGTVTAVSVASANGFAGTSSGGATPALTLKTTITGLLKGNGTAISAAVSDTDYQAPVSLTTTGTSGAATFSGNTLNVPNYGSGGPFLPTAGGTMSGAIDMGDNYIANLSHVVVGDTEADWDGVSAVQAKPLNTYTVDNLDQAISASQTGSGAFEAVGTSFNFHVYAYKNIPSGKVFSTNNDGVAFTDSNNSREVLTVSANADGTGYNLGDVSSIQAGNNQSQLIVASVDGPVGGINTIAADNNGSGYNIGDTVYVDGGSPGDAMLTVASTGAGGSVTGWTINSVGGSYSVGTGIATNIISGGGDNTATVDITSIFVGAVTGWTVNTGGQGYPVVNNQITTPNTGSGSGATANVLTVSAMVTYDVDLTWDASGDADGYRVLLQDSLNDYNYDHYIDTATNSLTYDGTTGVMSGSTVTPFSPYSTPTENIYGRSLFGGATDDGLTTGQFYGSSYTVPTVYTVGNQTGLADAEQPGSSYQGTTVDYYVYPVFTSYNPPNFSGAVYGNYQHITYTYSSDQLYDGELSWSSVSGQNGYFIIAVTGGNYYYVGGIETLSFLDDSLGANTGGWTNGGAFTTPLAALSAYNTMIYGASYASPYTYNQLYYNKIVSFNNGQLQGNETLAFIDGAGNFSTPGGITDENQVMSVNSNGRVLQDSSGNIIVDWGNQYLLDDASVTRMTFSTGQATQIFDQNGNFFLNSDTGAVRGIYDDSNQGAVDAQNRHLLADDGSTVNLDWSNPLYAASHTLQINGTIIDNTSIVPSIDTNARQLLGDDGSTNNLDWSNPGRVLVNSPTDDGTSALQVSGNISGNSTLTVGQSALENLTNNTMSAWIEGNQPFSALSRDTGLNLVGFSTQDSPGTTGSDPYGIAFTLYVDANGNAIPTVNATQFGAQGLPMWVGGGSGVVVGNTGGVPIYDGSSALQVYGVINIEGNGTASSLQLTNNYGDGSGDTWDIYSTDSQFGQGGHSLLFYDQSSMQPNSLQLINDSSGIARALFNNATDDGTSALQVNGNARAIQYTTDGTNYWEFGAYMAGVAVQAGQVALTINGTTYQLLTA